MYRLLDLIGESGSNGYGRVKFWYLTFQAVSSQSCKLQLTKSSSLKIPFNVLSMTCLLGHMRLSQGSISKHWIVLR